ncbi:MAG: YabP/YqfC family sporulation protein [Clostridia bacterium]|nr:YabP/YqfC family sporulation protein [Clostridia bacterium]
MKGIEKLCKALGVDGEILPCAYRYFVYGSVGAKFECATIESYAPCEIILAVRGGKLKVSGKNLSVENYVENEVVLLGEVSGVAKI